MKILYWWLLYFAGSLGTASEIGLFYDIDIDRGSIFASSLLYDVGRDGFTKRIVSKKHYWARMDNCRYLTMRQHIYWRK